MPKTSKGNWRTQPQTHKEIRKHAVDRDVQIEDLAELCWAFYSAFKELPEKQIKDIMSAAKVDPYYPGRVAHLARAVLGHNDNKDSIAAEPE